VLADLPLGDLEEVIERLEVVREHRRHMFLFGNGGSAATASHIANDLAKATIAAGLPKLRVVALTDNVPLITAWANDKAYEAVFAEQLDNLVAPGDLVVGISTSGDSPNVLRAFELAKARGAVTVALTGQTGGALKGLADICLMVPSRHTQLVEDVHLAIGHCLLVALRARAEQRSRGPAPAAQPARSDVRRPS
jgi:D-sedoheptulose 7-phosphate isomerase